MRGEIEEIPSFVFSTMTGPIKVSAQPMFLDEHSSPADRQYVWAYKIKIENHGSDAVQLLARHWRITDCNGLTQEVEGSGVVGEQPVLGPGEEFEYSSYTQLQTPSGIMGGSYRMSGGDGKDFEVAIPIFSLDSPDQLEYPN